MLSMVAKIAPVLVVVAVACSAGGSSQALPPGAKSVTGGCGSTALDRGARPAWTVASGGPADLIQARGHDGQVAAFIFAYPLRAGHPENPASKILWVVRQPRDGSDLLLSGHLLSRATPTVELRRTADSGPGEIYPSIVDVPASGCWTFTLKWHGHSDTIELPYAPGG
jgi:hypothetical protein